MGRVADWYHERQIRQLQERWAGEVDVDEVRKDYTLYRESGTTALMIALQSRGRNRDVDYACSIMNQVDEGLPRQLGRVVVDVLDRYLPVR